jgi:hypothetical protein
MLNKVVGRNFAWRIPSLLPAVVASLLFAGGAQAAAVPIVNPGFDVDDATSADVFCASGWVCFGGGTFTTNPANGANSPVAQSPNNSFKTFSTSGAYQSFSASAGDIFNMSGFGQNFSLDAIAAGSQLLLQIAFFDAEGKPAGTAAGGQVAPGFNLFDSNPVDSTTPQNVWTAMGVGTNAAPDNTAEVRFIVLGLLGSGGAGFIDDISATVVPVPAAVWLFGSALGLLGWMKRKAS